MQGIVSYQAQGGKDTAFPKPKLTNAPIFLENPDGTITEAIPSSYKDAKSKADRRNSRRGSGRTDESDNSSVLSETSAATRDIDFLYSRHESVLILLLVVQVLIEILYNVVYVLRMLDGSSVVEFSAMYSLTAWRIASADAEVLLWIVFAVHIIYSVAYYIVAGVAIWTKKPRQYRLFANVAIAGIVGLVLLAYLDKFNLILFFLNLLTYIYARFLQGLTASLLLLPALPTNWPVDA